MNKNFRTIWNDSLGAWVAVSEIETAKGKRAQSECTDGTTVSDGLSATKKFIYSILAASLLTVGGQAFAAAINDGNGNYSIAISPAGSRATANGEDTIAIGHNASTGSPANAQSVAIGAQANASGDQSVALGGNAQATGNSSIAVGGDDLDKVASTNPILWNAVATEKESHNLNNQAAAIKYKDLTGDYLVDFTNRTRSRYAKTIAGAGAVAVGVQAVAADLSTAFGTRARATGTASLALGVGSTSDLENSVAIGAGSNVGTGATQVSNAGIKQIDGSTLFIAFAGGNKVAAGDVVSFGSAGYERQLKNVAPGEVNAASTDAVNGSQLYAVASNLLLNSDHYYSIKSTEQGAGSNYNNDGATGADAIAAGVRTTAAGERATAIGSGAKATALESISIGTDNVVGGDRSGAVGKLGNISGSGSYGIGNNNTVANSNTFVLGNAVTSSQDNSVILGNSSADKAAEAVSSIDIGGKTHQFAGVGSAANGVVSVGAAGKERQIVNVAAGRVAGDSTDAINGSQLYAVANAAQVKNTVAKGTNIASITEATNTSGGKEYTINAEGTVVETGDGLTVSSNNDAKTNDTTYTVSLSDTAKASLQKADSAVQTLTTSVNGTQAETLNQTNRDINFVNGAGTTARSVGGNITFDVNKSALITSPSGQVSAAAAGDNFATAEQVAGAINAATTATEKTTTAKNTDGNLSVVGTVTGNNTDYVINLSRNINVDKVSVGTGTVSLSENGLNNGGKTITNVAAGSVAAGSTDAVNGDQLYRMTEAGKTHYFSVDYDNDADKGGNYDNDGATGSYAVAVGVDAESAGSGAVSLGWKASAKENYDIAIGSGAKTNSKAKNAGNSAGGSALAFGTNAKADGSNAVGIGNQAEAEGDSAIALGGKATGVGAVSVGYQAKAQNISAVSVGYAANSSGQNATAVGTQANATGIQSLAAGSSANASGYNAAAVGAQAVASATSAAAFGNDAQARHEHSVAIGSSSVTDEVQATSDAKIGSIAYGGFAGANPTATVSIGKKNQERTLTNLAAGRITAESTDAVNGSQLYATDNVINTLGSSVGAVLGGTAKMGSDGTVTMTDIGGTGKNTVHEAIRAGKTEVQKGTNIADVIAGKGSDGQTVYTVNAEGTNVAGSDAVSVTSVKDNAANDTNYTIDLSDASKASLQKADSALQNVTSKNTNLTATKSGDTVTLDFLDTPT
ncbi:ESPR-type extended signal peptide-containing protein, partial [Neisseria chenwenguii]